MRLWKRFWARALISAGVGIAVFVLSALSPLLWDSALLAGWDAGVATWMILTISAITRADAKRTWEHSQALEPETMYVFAIVIVTAAVGMLGAVGLATREAGRSILEQNLHFAAGTIAVVLAWLFVHTEFGLYYARLYYDEATPDIITPDTAPATNAPTTLVPYRKGLEFPDGELVDYWAFMYYSFTIAMCYQTSDVTVTGSLMRRMTLLHAIISFAFVLVILGYTVNAIATAV
jgi:uncharacterized membrane protein